MFLCTQQFMTVIMYDGITTDARNFILQHGRRPATFATTVRSLVNDTLLDGQILGIG